MDHPAWQPESNDAPGHLRHALSAPRPTEDAPDPRTPGQRRADALVDVCKLVNECGELPENGGDRPQVVVTIDYQQLRNGVRAKQGAGSLDNGTQLSPQTVRQWACDAEILPVVLSGTSQVLDVGRERRSISGAIRRALVVRDKGCAFPCCGRPPRWCQGHHVKHWIDHGKTSLENSVLLCGHHHRLIHHSEWTVHIKNGRPVFTPPPDG